MAGQICAALADRIVSGKLAPGARLRQDQLALEFRSSHVPVREAFRRLEAGGLVMSEPRRGTRVSPLDAASIVEAVEMRAALEGLALRHALPRLTQDDLALAGKALRLAERSRSITVWEEANRRFHTALVAPCGMGRLIAAIDDLHRASARYLFAAWRDLDWRARSDDEHRSILAAIRDGDAEASIAQLARHIRAAGEALVSALRA